MNTKSERENLASAARRTAFNLEQAEKSLREFLKIYRALPANDDELIEQADLTVLLAQVMDACTRLRILADMQSQILF